MLVFKTGIEKRLQSINNMIFHLFPSFPHRSNCALNFRLYLFYLLLQHLRLTLVNYHLPMESLCDFLDAGFKLAHHELLGIPNLSQHHPELILQLL